MGEIEHGRQTQPVYRPLVAFDFDGTLTERDSFTTFLAWRAGRGTFIAGVLASALRSLRFAFDRDRGKLKAAPRGASSPA